MVTKLFAGIDISANDAVFCCLDQDGNQLGPSRKFANDLHGANELLDTITRLTTKTLGLLQNGSALAGLSPFLLGKSLPNPYSN
ncbi:MAG: Transposase [Clostridia bacterium 41_269]|nr:MAG: Transposase [Clostridia bacterium 41_269]